MASTNNMRLVEQPKPSFRHDTSDADGLATSTGNQYRPTFPLLGGNECFVDSHVGVELAGGLSVSRGDSVHCHGCSV